jgi:serine/threonine protein kinase/Tol biopolymer transport system component
MSLTAGALLGPYEIGARIGVGGMGEVYRATDTNLGREVAIKVLPDTFATDAERLARFDREAKTLAALNHPNIAHIYGLERADGRIALVMELVGGETLADRITHGALHVDEALPIAKQLVEALEAAHDQGIVHRDLKPANIKVRADGTVKVLDFGLAKVLEPATAAVDASQSPTITSPAMTGLGMILGTAAYMSPEQVRGRPADKRSDIWSFGCVIYEMLTGRPAFARETVSETIAAILENEPEWTALRSTPAALQTLLRWCLTKNPRNRLQAIGDARHLLAEEQLTAVVDLARNSSRSARVAWVFLAVTLIGLAAVSWLYFGSRPLEAPETRVDIVTGATSDPFSLALSPNGRWIAFVATSDGVQRLWLRSLDRATAQPLSGTEGAGFPFWSPDSRAVGFWADGKLKRINVEGGSAQTITDAAPRGGAWNADGSIVFAPRALGPLFVVRASGGEIKQVTRLDDQQSSHRFPHFLADGRQFLFYAQGTPATAGIYLGSLDGAPPKRLAASDAAGAYVPDGWLLFVRSGSLLAQQLDVPQGRLTGDPVTVADSIAFDPYRQASALSVSAAGLIGYRSAAATRLQLTWFDRAGKILDTVGSPDDNAPVAPRISPDGSRVAVFRTVQQNTDIWILDKDRIARFTFDPSLDRFPIWSPDHTQILFQSTRQYPNDLYKKATSLVSDEELVVGSDQDKRPTDWSPDGRFISYWSTDPETSNDIWILPLGAGKRPLAFLKTPADERGLMFSRNGRWVAYYSNASGRYEVYVRPFPGPGVERQISTVGGVYPVWAPHDSELYYLALDGTMMAASISVAGGTLQPGRVQPLFTTRMYGSADPNVGLNYDVSADGRFLINRVLDDAVPITLVQNWKPR